MHGLGNVHKGEILARGFNSDEATVNAWRNSPSHNRVMNNFWWYVGYAKRDGYTVVTFSR